MDAASSAAAERCRHSHEDSSIEELPEQNSLIATPGAPGDGPADSTSSQRTLSDQQLGTLSSPPSLAQAPDQIEVPGPPVRRRWTKSSVRKSVKPVSEIEKDIAKKRGLPPSLGPLETHAELTATARSDVPGTVPEATGEDGSRPQLRRTKSVLKKRVSTAEEVEKQKRKRMTTSFDNFTLAELRTHARLRAQSDSGPASPRQPSPAQSDQPSTEDANPFAGIRFKSPSLDAINSLNVTLHDRRTANKQLQAALDAKYSYLAAPIKAPMSERFLDADCEARYSHYRQYKLFEEKYVDTNDSANAGLLKYITGNGLIETVQMHDRFEKQLIFEFYANLLPAHVKNCRKLVYIRGKSYEWSPSLINKVFNIKVNRMNAGPEWKSQCSKTHIMEYLTGQNIENWKDCKPKFLSSDLSALFSVLCLNWMPVSNNTYITQERGSLLYKLANEIPFNFGKLI